MDNLEEERLLRKQKLHMMLNKARFQNNQAATEEISRAHGIITEINSKSTVYDTPLRLQNTVETKGPTSEDHLKDQDVSTYLKSVKKIDPTVYKKYEERKEKSVVPPIDFFNDELAENLKTIHNKKVEKSRERNLRAMNYDISGKYQVDFINDSNKKYNKKLARAYNDYTADIRLNIERGGGA